MVDEVLAQDLDNLELLLVRQAGNGGLDDTADGRVVRCNEAAVVEKGNGAHDELAVEAIRRAAVAGDRVTKVFDLEGALEARRKETTKGRDERGESCEDDHVKLDRHNVETVRNRKICGDALGYERDCVSSGVEDGVRLAFEAGENVCAKVVDRTDEELVLRKEMSCEDAPDNGKEPGAEETFPRLLGRDLDQLMAAEGDAAEVGEDVVCDYHGDGQDEPDEAFEDVVDDEVGLADDEEEGHVGPGELGELELVVALLQGEDEEDKACAGQDLKSPLLGESLPIMYSMKEMNLWWVARGSRILSTSRMCLK